MEKTAISKELVEKAVAPRLSKLNKDYERFIPLNPASESILNKQSIRTYNQLEIMKLTANKAVKDINSKLKNLSGDSEEFAKLRELRDYFSGHANHLHNLTNQKPSIIIDNTARKNYIKKK